MLWRVMNHILVNNNAIDVITGTLWKAKSYLLTISRRHREPWWYLWVVLWSHCYNILMFHDFKPFCVLHAYMTKLCDTDKLFAIFDVNDRDIQCYFEIYSIKQNISKNNSGVICSFVTTRTINFILSQFF